MAHRVHGQLIPISGGDPIPLIRESLTVGRLESCDIPLRLPNVSKTHCRLIFHNGLWWIEDMGSTNGVKVNGIRVTRKVLHPEDTITIAKRTYTIDYTPPVGQNALDEVLEDDPMSQPLLEKAGLIRPRREDERYNPKGRLNMRRLMESAEEEPSED
jgi:adenylate cyclase